MSRFRLYMKKMGLYLYWRSMKALFCGDYLPVFRNGLAAESVGPINLDPPFTSNATYNVCIGAYSGRAGGLVGTGDNSQESTFTDGEKIVFRSLAVTHSFPTEENCRSDHEGATDPLDPCSGLTLEP